MNRTITDEKVQDYFDITGNALVKARQALKDNERYRDAEICIDMAERYYSDAHHFRENKDIVLAFAALNYAHGWLDSAAMLGLIKVDDDALFTVDGRS